MYARIRTDDFVIHLYGAKVMQGVITSDEVAIYGEPLDGDYQATIYGKDGKPKASYLVTIAGLKAGKPSAVALPIKLELV